MTTQTSVSENVLLLEEAYGLGKNLLGGKGHGLAEMTHAGLPVPPGLIITTKVCSEYYENGERFPEYLMPSILEKMKKIEERTGKKFGKSLLVSVRSGAPLSMPGMMDTVLNLGLNDEVLKYLISSTGNERFAYDAYRRFIQMYGKIVEHIEGSKFEDMIQEKKNKRGVKNDVDLGTHDLSELVQEFKSLFQRETGKEFPQDPKEQLRRAIEAVLLSWNGKRAKEYRRFYKIDEKMGTAVNIVAMIFGNTGDRSGSGVGFTRNPNTGENKLFAEFLINAQGEDVVSGARTPYSIEEIEEKFPDLYAQLQSIATLLEKHYRDMQDFEFTVENGKLWMLQTRTGKRTAQSAVKIALDMVKEGLISKEDATLRVDPLQLDQLLHKHIDPNAHVDVLVKGIAASPGAAVGKAIFDTNKAAELGKLGESVILVRRETAPEDIHGMIASQGVLTQRGGKTCHAAVVARGMGKPAVVGAESLVILDNHAKSGDVIIGEGDIITIDGGTGDVILGTAPLVDAEISEDLDEFLTMADSFRRNGVWANADTPTMVAKAIEFKAEGFGLVRTERMFNAKTRLPYVQRMIISDTVEERKKWLEKLKEFQKKDFLEIFLAAKGRPVVIRLLDLPQHEFLHAPASPELGDLIAKKLPTLKEDNPMLGHRGIRLGVTYPEIYEMQSQAIAEAKAEAEERGVKVKAEIMLPLTSEALELRRLRELISKPLHDSPIGTMIETPRAAVTAGEIAKSADFFSFGTNDLTQMTFGMSRDDAEGKFLVKYVEEKLLPNNPFEVIDKEGVGRLMTIAAEEGRKSNPRLEVGVCGEAGGDPESIEFFITKVGVNYTSCSPYRVPIARLAAAQSAIRNSSKELDKEGRKSYAASV
ncbi:MAG TPA: pyruvate, phosphate dikinase [Nitrososphaerales archaeon]|nr:pyruvate, phosphate dikinase [Nitrososphaerales archaeon]